MRCGRFTRFIAELLGSLKGEQWCGYVVGLWDRSPLGVNEESREKKHEMEITRESAGLECEICARLHNLQFR